MLEHHSTQKILFRLSKWVNGALPHLKVDITDTNSLIALPVSILFLNQTQMSFESSDTCFPVSDSKVTLAQLELNFLIFLVTRAF